MINNYDELNDKIIELYNKKYSDLYVESKKNFIGFKLDSKDKYFMLYILEKDNDVFIFYRKDINNKAKVQIKLSYEDLQNIDNIISSIINDVIKTKNNESGKKIKAEKKVRKLELPKQRKVRLKNDPRVAEIDNKIEALGSEYIKNKYGSILLKDMPISSRLYNSLRHAWIRNAADLINRPILSCYKIKNIGRRTIEEVIEYKKSVLENEKTNLESKKIEDKIVDNLENDNSKKLIELLKFYKISNSVIMLVILGIGSHEEYYNVLFNRLNNIKDILTDDIVKRESVYLFHEIDRNEEE